MDKISSNPAFNYAQLYQQNVARKSTTAAETRNVAPTEQTATAQASEPRLANDFSSMFGDDELAKLQRNLEAIAQLADRALQNYGA